MTAANQYSSELSPLTTGHANQPIVLAFERFDDLVAPTKRVKPTGFVRSSPGIVLDIWIVWDLFVEKRHRTGSQCLESATVPRRAE